MTVAWHSSMSTISATDWNRLAQASPTPLLTHEWLHHLETSGSIIPSHGWQPSHLTVTDDSTLVGAVPLYVRDQSWGEFVFDFAFAEVAGQVGARYYPKLVGMSPATPSPAFGFLIEPGREDELTPFILGEINVFCRQNGIGALQFNFVVPEWQARLAEHGLVTWEHQGYEWRNEDFTRFEDYLGRFRKNQRRNIRRERASMEEQGLTLTVRHAPEAPAEWFPLMAEYYVRTNEQFGPYGARFLTRAFFTEMPPAVQEHVWFVAACEDRYELPVAMAMLVRKGTRILGRYWGTVSPATNLHFNVCYYTPIEWAIAEGITHFDPGMGSEHKVRRGFRSVATYSMHRFIDPHMHRILEANIDRINAYEREQITMLDNAVPYKIPESNR